MIRRSLLLAAALLGHASAVHYFKGFTSKKDMELNRMLVNGEGQDHLSVSDTFPIQRRYRVGL
jgi:hypothetical protein